MHAKYLIIISITLSAMAAPVTDMKIKRQGGLLNDVEDDLLDILTVTAPVTDIKIKRQGGLLNDVEDDLLDILTVTVSTLLNIYPDLINYIRESNGGELAIWEAIAVCCGD
jgi:hypothetical protein